MDKNAIVVTDVYKKFGSDVPPFWRQLIKVKSKSNGSNGANGNGSESNGNAAHANSNGHYKTDNNKKRRMVVAVDRVSFHIKQGEVFGVLGPNGSGKSTLIRLLSTLLLPDEGQITVMGHDPVAEPLVVQELINRVSVEASFFKKLSPMENLLYGARLYGMNGKDSRKKAEHILIRLGLEKRSIYSPMEDMSRGMQQKVAIARALLSKPKVLLLDEPTTGLDPVSKRQVQAVVRELQDKDGVTILLTTHDMMEAEKLCNRVAIMHNGKIVALDTPEELKKLVPDVDGEKPTLEDVFIHLTGDQLREFAEVENED